MLPSRFEKSVFLFDPVQVQGVNAREETAKLPFIFSLFFNVLVSFIMNSQGQHRQCLPDVEKNIFNIP